MSIATTWRPAAARACRMSRKSSLLPVYPGTRRAGCPPRTPLGGGASRAANLPRLVSMVSRRTPEGNCRAFGVLTGRQPTHGYSGYALTQSLLFLEVRVKNLASRAAFAAAPRPAAAAAWLALLRGSLGLGRGW